ncbi:MAG TPA: DUF4383 domain-containing protein, partial [Terriglobia bacterium]|nr:DUF4383 domain-containing protein [Terriglobia bacterium]
LQSAREDKFMAKTVTTFLGAAFLLVGLLGFVVPDFLGAHLTPVHNIVHLGSGALALYFGLSGTLTAARLFNIVFGSVYGLLGLIGFVGGQTGISPLHGLDSRILEVIPGVLVLGTTDHIIHIVLGAIFLVSGMLTKPKLYPEVTQPHTSIRR